MRFVTRNLLQGGPKDFSALRKTLSLLQPDVLFLQECCDPQHYAGYDDYAASWSPVPHGKWGSAILIRKDFQHGLFTIELP